MPVKMKMMLSNGASVQRIVPASLINQQMNQGSTTIGVRPMTNLNYSMVGRLMGSKSGCGACGK
jgi:hypothetical protein